MIINKFLCILIVLFFLYSLVWNIIRFVYFIKCLKITECSNNNCKNKEYCRKYEYESKLTDEEAEELIKLLEEYDTK